MDISQIRAKRMALLQKHFQTRFVNELKSLSGVFDAFIISDDMTLTVGQEDESNTKVDSLRLGDSNSEVVEWVLNVIRNFGVEEEMIVLFGYFKLRTTSVSSSFPEMWIQLRMNLDEKLISNLLEIERYLHIRVPGRDRTLRFYHPEGPYLEAHIVDDDYWANKSAHKK